MDLHSTLLAMPVASWLWAFAISFGPVFIFLNVIDAVLFNFARRDLVAKALTAAMAVLIVNALSPSIEAWFALRALPVVLLANAAYFRQVRQLAMLNAVRTDGKTARYADGTLEKLPVPSHLFVALCVLICIAALRFVPLAFLQVLRSCEASGWVRWIMVGLSALMVLWAAHLLTRDPSDIDRGDAMRAAG